MTGYSDEQYEEDYSIIVDQLEGVEHGGSLIEEVSLEVADYDPDTGNIIHYIAELEFEGEVAIELHDGSVLDIPEIEGFMYDPIVFTSDGTIKLYLFPEE